MDFYVKDEDLKIIEEKLKTEYSNWEEALSQYKSLSDYTKQVRKEVCEEIKKDFDKKVCNEFGDSDMPYITLDIQEVNFYLQDKSKGE